MKEAGHTLFGGGGGGLRQEVDSEARGLKVHNCKVPAPLSGCAILPSRVVRGRKKLKWLIKIKIRNQDKKKENMNE